MSVGIVVPCFNEAERWNEDYWRAMVDRVAATFLFVDDGSSDETPALLEQLHDVSQVQVLTLPRNGGKAEAVRAGMNQLLGYADIDGVGYLDADGAFHQDDVVGIADIFSERVATREFDAVWSSRVALSGRDIERSQSRHYVGRIVATYLSASETSFPYDTQSGYKLFVDSETLRRCLALPFVTRWLFEIELLARWRRDSGAPMQIWEEPLDYWHDVPGSKINFTESWRIVRELMKVKAEQRRKAH